MMSGFVLAKTTAYTFYHVPTIVTRTAKSTRLAGAILEGNLTISCPVFVHTL